MSPEKLQKQCDQHEKVLFRLLAFYEQHKDEECGQVLERTLARIVTSQYKIYLMFGNERKKDLLQLERRLKKDYPAVYHSVTNSGIILLRKGRYMPFKLVSWAARRRG